MRWHQMRFFFLYFFTISFRTVLGVLVLYVLFVSTNRAIKEKKNPSLFNTNVGIIKNMCVVFFKVLERAGWEQKSRQRLKRILTDCAT